MPGKINEVLSVCSSLGYLPEHLQHTNTTVNVRASTQIKLEYDEAERCHLIQT